MKVTYKQHCGNDLMVVNAARVSFDKESDWVRVDVPEDDITEYHPAWFDTEQNRWRSTRIELSQRDQKLIAFLAREGHFSPFNHTFITMHVKAPIFVARQLVKHKFMPWNEVSRRYVAATPEFFEPDVWRMRADNVKQGSSDEAANIDGLWMSDYMDTARDTYAALLEVGVCPEQARMVLPQSMYTEWYWSGTLGAWAAMYNLRSKSDTQRETREVALMAGEIIAPLFPHSWKALTS